jgi:hypothetical protein
MRSEKDIEAAGGSSTLSSNFAPTTVATAVAGAIPNSRGAWGGRRLYCDNGAPKVESRMFIAANGSSVVAKARAVVGAKNAPARCERKKDNEWKWNPVEEFCDSYVSKIR